MVMLSRIYTLFFLNILSDFCGGGVYTLNGSAGIMLSFYFIDFCIVSLFETNINIDP